MMRRTTPLSLIALTTLLAACSQDTTPHVGPTTSVVIKTLALPAQVKFVTLELQGNDVLTKQDSKTYTAALAGGVGTVQLGKVVKGPYTLIARGYDADDKLITLYKTSQSVNIQTADPISLRMNRVTSAITVNASGVSAKSNVLVAKVSGLEARLIAGASSASGSIQGVATARSLNVLVEGRDAQGILRQQGQATLDLSEQDQTVSVNMQDLTALAPVIANISAPSSVKVGDNLNLRVQGSDPNTGGDQLQSMKVEWGDGSADTVPVNGNSLDFTSTHAYSAPGTFTATVTVTNTAGLSATGSLQVTVLDATNPDVNIDIGAESVPATLNFSGIPANAERVQAVVNAPLGAQQVRPADLKSSYTLELIPRGNGTWGGTLGLPQDFTYGVSLRVTSPEGVSTGVSQNITPTGQVRSFDLAYTPTSLCPTPDNLTAIAAIQGSGATSPLANTTVVTRGVVTLDAQAGMSGFFMQSETPDNDPATSDGLFVYTGTTPRTVTAGDVVQVAGTVTEFGTGAPVTELTSLTAFASCGTASVAPVDVTFPVSSATDLERFEGLLIRIPTLMTVTDNYGYGRYGELGLASGGRVFNPTNGQGGDSSSNALRRIVLDDVRGGQNPATLPYLSADNTRRTGDTVMNLTGTVHYVGGGYRLEPTVTPTFVTVNPRLAAPVSVGGTLKVAGANVLNYFTQLVTSNTGCTTDGVNGSARGANNCVEFQRQQTKVVAALKGLDADVVTLMEVQNNSDDALNNLVAALNAAYGSEVYKAVATGTIGTDAIKVAILYKPARVSLERPYVIDNNSVYSRPPLAQTFRDLGTNGVFTVVANHLKSKGSCPKAGTDLGNQDSGQGCWNALRTGQATALLNFVSTLRTQTGDQDVLLMGDFNAYGDEDPIKLISNPDGANFESLNKRIPADERYSFQFNGEFGYLDHALASPTLAQQVTGITEWHINSDEPIFLDYNVEFKNHAACTSSTCTTPDLYTADAYRASDHDPVLVGLNLAADAAAPIPLSLNLSGADTATTGQPYTLSLGASKTLSSVTVTWEAGGTPETVSASASTVTHTYTSAGTPTITVTATAGSETVSAEKSVTVTTPPPHVVINQIRTGSAASAQEEFVELFNPASVSVDLSTCSIVYRAAAGTTDTILVASIGKSIAAGKYLLIGSSTFNTNSSVKPDVLYSTASSMSGTGGGVALKCSGVVDSVGYGTATNAFVETKVAAAPTNTQAIIRTNAVDTDNNSVDFTVTVPTPSNSVSP